MLRGASVSRIRAATESMLLDLYGRRLGRKISGILSAPRDFVCMHGQLATSAWVFDLMARSLVYGSDPCTPFPAGGSALW